MSKKKDANVACTNRQVALSLFLKESYARSDNGCKQEMSMCSQARVYMQIVTKRLTNPADTVKPNDL